MDALLTQAQQREAEVIAELTKLSRTHGAESRAADVVAKAVLRDHFRFCPAFGWLEWDGRHWDCDDVAEPRVIETVRLFMDTTERDYRAKATAADTRIQELIKVFAARDADEKYSKNGEVDVKALLNSGLVTDEDRKAYKSMQDEVTRNTQQADIWLNLLSTGQVGAVTRLCRGMEGIITRALAFDNHPDLFNCHNGVVDLRDGSLLPHHPNYLLMHLAGGPYIPGARSAAWDQALHAVHPDIMHWFQVRMGQSITGYTPGEDELVCNVGGGENGKSAIMLGVLRGVGTYGALISHQVLLAQPGQHTTELMDLRGLRFALLEETPEEGRLDTHRLKQTIGAVKIRARRMRKDPVEFAPTHSLWINTNFPPQVDTTDHGTWRRLKAMPWVYRFLKPGQQLTEANDRVGDLTLKSRLALTEDVPAAVIAWMVVGAMAWYQNNRMMPPDPELVVGATSGWRQTSDVGYRFAMERLAPGYRSPEVSYFITAETMRAEFTAFLGAEGKAIWSSQLINNRLGPSMLAAGITTSKDPSKASKVREGDVESRPERPTVVLSNGQVAPALRDAAPVPPGKTCRLWRGVRFKTEWEMREDTSHLKVV